MSLVLALLGSFWVSVVPGGAPPAAAAPHTITVASELLHLPLPLPSPGDPNRCVVTSFVQIVAHPREVDTTSYHLSLHDNVFDREYTDDVAVGSSGFRDVMIAPDGSQYLAPPGTHRFWLGQGSVPDGCASGLAQAARWGTPTVTLEVELKADFVGVSLGRGEYRFDPDAWDGIEPYTYFWDFGNGEVSEEETGRAHYTAPGTYSVQLWVTDSSDTVAYVQHNQVVTAPSLQVTVDYVDPNARLALNTPTDIIVKITAGDGAGPLQDLNFIGEVFAGEVVRSVPSGAIETVAGPTPAPGFSFELQPGESRSYVVTVVPRAVGRISLFSEIAGSDAAGNDVADTDELVEILSALEVTVTPEKDNVELGVDFLPDNIFKVSVQVKNISDSTTVTDIFVAGNPPILIGPIENDLAHQNSVFVVPVDPDGDGPLPPEPNVTQDDGLIGTLAPGETSEPVVYYLQGIRGGRSPLEVLVRGADGLSSVTALGKGSVNVVENVLVEFEAHEQPGAPDRAGQTVTIDGTVRNLSKTKWLKVLAYPDTDLNAGNGFLTTTKGGATPTEPEVWTLPPDLETPLELTGILVTSAAAANSQAKVSYTVFAVAADEEAGPYTDVSSQVRIVDGDHAHPIVATLGPADAEIDEILDQCGSRALVWIAWCGFNIGGGNFVYGIGDLFINGWEELKNKSASYLRLVGYARLAWYHGATAVLNDPVAKEHLLADIRVALTDMFPVLGAQASTAQIPALAAAVVNDMLAWMTQRVGDIVEGDMDQLTLSAAQVLGENADIVFEGGVKLALVAARRRLLTQISRGFARGAEEQAVVRQAMEKDLAKQQESLASRVEGAEAAGQTDELLRKATIPGDDLEAVAGLLQKAWGVSADAIAALKKLCERENIMVLLRGRGAGAIELINQGLAWAKPAWMKAKNVATSDLRLFGSGAVRRDVVVIAEPPFGNKAEFEIDWDANPDTLKAQADRAATEWFRENEERLQLLAGVPGDAVDATREQLISRASQRAQEWATYGRKEFQLHTPNPATSVEANIAFDASTQEGNVLARRDDVRQFQVKPATETANGWKVYEVQMSGRKTKGVFDPNSWKAITGDVDLLGILHLDGSAIDTVVDKAKKARIYEALQEILDIQHGETMSAFDLDDRAEWLRAYGDELAVVDPRTVRRGKVIDVATIAADNPNAKYIATPAGVFVPRKTKFVLIDGVRPVLQSDYLKVLSVTLPNSLSYMQGIVDRLLKVGALRIVLTPLDRLLDEVDGLDPAATTDAHSRSAPIVQPDGAGGLWRFRPTGGGPVVGPSSAPATLAAAAAEPPPGWEPIGLDAAIALGSPGVLDTAPVTALLDDAAAGSTRLEIMEPSDLRLAGQTDWFHPGDPVVIDPGGPNEEYATVAALGSLILQSPLRHDHGFGEMVAFVGDVTGEQPTNHAPVCAAASLNVAAGTTTGVAPSCTDDDGDPLTYEIASQGTQGVASVTAGQLRYAAGATASGPDQFTYVAHDGKGGTSAPAAVIVTVVQCAASTTTSTRGTAIWFGSATAANGAITSRATVTDHVPAALQQALAADATVDPRARDVGAFVDATTAAQWVAGAAEGLPAEANLRAALGAQLVSPVFDAVVPRGTVDLVVGETVATEPCANAVRTVTTRYVARVSLFELDAHEAPTGPGPGLTVSVGSASAREGSVWWWPTTLRVPVTLSAPAPQEGVTVRYSTVDGTARHGSDFVARSGTLRFATGQTTRTVDVLLIGDRDVEPDETFLLRLTQPAGATLAVAEGTGTIVNDDAVEVTITPVVCGAEPRPGTTATFSFAVRLSAPAAPGGLTVDFSTRSGTARAGSDFDAVAGTLAFVPGQRTRTIGVTVRGDNRAEGDEQFFVDLGVVSAGGSLGTSSTGRGIISSRCSDRARS